MSISIEHKCSQLLELIHLRRVEMEKLGFRLFKIIMACSILNALVSIVSTILSIVANYGNGLVDPIVNNFWWGFVTTLITFALSAPSILEGVSYVLQNNTVIVNDLSSLLKTEMEALRIMESVLPEDSLLLREKQKIIKEIELIVDKWPNDTYKKFIKNNRVLT